jgi:putative hydrolase
MSSYKFPRVNETDMHTHTVASTHAFCTVLEMANYAAQTGMKAIAVTDHGPALPDGAHIWHFNGMRKIPERIAGVRVYRGAEANIIGFDGSLDIPDDILRSLEWVIVSFHAPACAPGSEQDHTAAYLRLADNPLVDVIGHSGTGEFKYDYEKVIPVFGRKNKLVEINSHSFAVRKGAPENCRDIALLCKKYRVPIVVNSDSHICYTLGDLHEAFEMLGAIDFPPELIVNLTYARVDEWIRRKKAASGGAD